MKILIHGSGTENKGAELMAVAIKEEVGQWATNVSLFVPADFGTQDDCESLGFGIALDPLPSLASVRKFAKCVARNIKTIISAKWRGIPVCGEQKIDVIIDVTGFGFSSAFGDRPTVSFSAKCVRWKAADKKIILMPQALGPFEGEKISRAFLSVLKSADLAFARDVESLRYASATANGELPKSLKIGPDFTCLVAPRETEPESRKHPFIAFVPNQRFKEFYPQRFGEYKNAFIRAILLAKTANYNPVLMAHSKDDLRLLMELQKQIDFPLDVEHVEGAVVGKQILAEAKAVVGSRFHALVGALSQGVPTIGVGWSHKYQQLFNDYGISEYCLDHQSRWDADLPAALSKLLSSRDVIKKQISDKAECEKAKTRTMWAEVRKALGVEVR